MTNREILADLGYEEAVIFDNPDYDDAIIGISYDNRVIYDYDKMVDSLVSTQQMTEEDAEDFILYNLSYSNSDTPIVMFGIEGYK